MYSMSYNYIISQYLIEHIGAQFCSLPWDSHEMYGIYLHCQVQLGPSGAANTMCREETTVWPITGLQ